MFAFLSSIGPVQIVIILLVALLLFGSRLPDVARKLGRSITEFKRGLQEVETGVKQGVEAGEKPEGEKPEGEKPEGETKQ